MMKKTDWDALRRAFAARYLATGNAYKSALAAGYAPETARAKSYLLPRDPVVVAEMHRLLEAGGARPDARAPRPEAREAPAGGCAPAGPEAEAGGGAWAGPAACGWESAGAGARVLWEIERMAFDDSTDFTSAGQAAGGRGRFKGSTKLRALELLARTMGLFERDAAPIVPEGDGGDMELCVRAASGMGGVGGRGG